MHWPELTVAIQEFQSVRQRTIDIATALSCDQAVHRMRPGTWSIADILDHLLQTEIAFRKYQREALERARSGVSGTAWLSFQDVDTRVRPLPKSWMPWLAPFLKAAHAVTPFGLRLAVMRNRGFIWAAAPKIALPTSVRKLDDLRALLATQLDQTLAPFLGDLPDIMPRVRTAHPLYGANNVAQVFRLMAAHEERHQQQMRMILRTK